MKKLLLTLLLVSTNLYAIEKECIEKVGNLCTIHRIKVPSGWIVIGGTELTFVPDKKHEWKI